MEHDPQTVVRESYHGQRLTEAQRDKAFDLTGVLHRDIQRTGSFVEPLDDFSHAFARTEQFSRAQAEDILRGVYQARYGGETMNQTRERLLEREDQTRDTQDHHALTQARKIAPMIREGLPWHQAQDRTAVELAREMGITERGAKERMAESFERHEGQPLYEHSKEIERQYQQNRPEADRRETIPERAAPAAPERRRSRRR